MSFHSMGLNPEAEHDMTRRLLYMRAIFFAYSVMIQNHVRKRHHTLFVSQEKMTKTIHGIVSIDLRHK